MNPEVDDGRLVCDPPAKATLSKLLKMAALFELEPPNCCPPVSCWDVVVGSVEVVVVVDVVEVVVATGVADWRFEVVTGIDEMVGVGTI